MHLFRLVVPLCYTNETCRAIKAFVSWFGLSSHAFCFSFSVYSMYRASNRAFIGTTQRGKSERGSDTKLDSVTDFKEKSS